MTPESSYKYLSRTNSEARNVDLAVSGFWVTKITYQVPTPEPAGFPQTTRGVLIPADGVSGQRSGMNDTIARCATSIARGVCSYTRLSCSYRVLLDMAASLRVPRSTLSGLQGPWMGTPSGEWWPTHHQSACRVSDSRVEGIEWRTQPPDPKSTRNPPETESIAFLPRNRRGAIADAAVSLRFLTSVAAAAVVVSE